MDTTISLHRVMASGFDWWRLNWRIAETLVASQAVIATRMAMIGGGMLDPGRVPAGEIGRLWPEKIAAFGQAGWGAARRIRPMQSTSGDPARIILGLFEQWLAMALAWWQPLHTRSTANARRLVRRRR